jgi:hypothetical protein
MAAPKTKIFVMSTVKTDAPAKKGEASSEAAAWARTLEIYLAEALTAKFSCSSTMTLADVGALLGHERDLQLLGAGGDPATLASLGSSVDAKYLISVTVTQAGGNTTVSTVVIDTRKAAVIARNVRVIPVNRGAADALEEFAKQSVGALGSSFIKCGTPGWKGSISVTTTKDMQGKNANGGGSSSEYGSATLECQLTGEGSRAVCSYNSSYVMQGNGVTLEITKTASKAEGFADASLGPRGLTLSIGVIPLTVVTKNSLAGGAADTSQESLTNQTFEVAATGNAKSQSGTWADPNPVTKQLGATVKVDWSLTKE